MISFLSGSIEPPIFKHTPNFLTKLQKKSRKTWRSGENVESAFILNYPNVCITCNTWNSTIFDVWNFRACTFASALSSSSSCVLIKVKNNHRNTCTKWSECVCSVYVSFGKWTNEKNGSSWLAKNDEKWKMGTQSFIHVAVCRLLLNKQ